MSSELALIEALRAIATSPGARGLNDDAAVLDFGGEKLVLTLDTIVETVHFLPDDPAEDVAWKLMAVNASDLSAKGAQPLGCLYSHALGSEAWDRAFLDGLAQASAHFAMPLLGGDTVRMPPGAPRSFSLTALGSVGRRASAPSRSTAAPGDRIWVSGCIGNSGLGLSILTGRPAQEPHAAWLTSRYRRPQPETALGPALARHVSAMMDVSDGLMIDARRMADASGVAIVLHPEAVPLSDAFVAVAGEDLDARLEAMNAGDDYCLLFTASPADTATIREIAAAEGCPVSAVGTVSAGEGLSLVYNGQAIPLPARLGYQH